MNCIPKARICLYCLENNKTIKVYKNVRYIPLTNIILFYLYDKTIKGITIIYEE